MTRPCFTLPFLIAALGGSLMCANTARSQVPADEDYGGYGCYYTYSQMEEDAYRETEKLNDDQQTLKDEFNQDLAGRAVVAVINDPVEEEVVSGPATGDEFEAYAVDIEHDNSSSQDPAITNECPGHCYFGSCGAAEATDTEATATAVDEPLDASETIGDPWAYARYGYGCYPEYDGGQATADTTDESCDASSEATEDEASVQDSMEDPWREAHYGYGYDYAYADDIQPVVEAGDDDSADADPEFGICYGEACPEERDAAGNGQELAEASAEPVDDSWKAARYRYIYGVGLSANVPATTATGMQSSEEPSDDEYADYEYSYEDAYGDAYSDSYDFSDSTADVADEVSSSNQPADESSDEVGDEYSAFESYGMESTIDDWYQTAGDQAMANAAATDASEASSTHMTESSSEPEYDPYGYRYAYGDWYDNAGDEAEAVEAAADQSLETPALQADSTADRYGDYDYGDGYRDWYDTLGDDTDTAADTANTFADDAADVSADSDSACDPYGYQEAYGNWYGEAAESVDTGDRNSDESAATSSSEEQPVTESACDDYHYADSYSDWYDMATEEADPVEIIPDEPRQTFVSEPVSDSDPLDEQDSLGGFDDGYGQTHFDAFEPAAAADSVTESVEEEADEISASSADTYGYESAYGSWYGADEDEDANESDVEEAAEQRHDLPATTYPYPYGYGYEYEYEWQKPAMVDRAESDQPTADPLESSVVADDIDYQQLAELGHQLVDIATRSKFVTLVEVRVNELIEQADILAERSDVVQVWHDLQSLVVAAACQVESVTDANTFLFEFDFEQQDPAARVPAAEQSPWMVEDEVPADDDLRRSLAGDALLSPCNVSQRDQDVTGQALIWMARALNRCGVVLQQASGHIEAIAAARPSMAAAEASDTMNR
jgi:hypothetical protein